MREKTEKAESCGLSGIDGKELTVSSFSGEVLTQAQEHEGIEPLRERRGITNKERDLKTRT